MTSGLGSIWSSQITFPRSARRRSTRCSHLGGDLRRVRRARAQHELRGVVELQRRVEQVRHALLARDPADEHDRRPVGVDAVLLEHVGAGVGRVLLGVDAVVDHLHALGVDRRIAARGCPRASPCETAITRVGALERDLLAPARQRVAAAELLGLPRPQRLERVHGRHVRDAVGQLRQVAGELRVPGVAVHDLGAARRRRPSRGRSTSRAAPPGAARRRPARPTPGSRPRPRGRRPTRARSRPPAARARAPRYSTCTPAPP